MTSATHCLDSLVPTSMRANLPDINTSTQHYPSEIYEGPMPLPDIVPPAVPDQYFTLWNATSNSRVIYPNERDYHQSEPETNMLLRNSQRECFPNHRFLLYVTT